MGMSDAQEQPKQESKGNSDSTASSGRSTIVTIIIALILIAGLSFAIIYFVKKNSESDGAKDDGKAKEDDKAKEGATLLATDDLKDDDKKKDDEKKDSKLHELVQSDLNVGFSSYAKKASKDDKKEDKKKKSKGDKKGEGDDKKKGDEKKKGNEEGGDDKAKTDLKTSKLQKIDRQNLFDANVLLSKMNSGVSA